MIEVIEFMEDVKGIHDVKGLEFIQSDPLSIKITPGSLVCSDRKIESAGIEFDLVPEEFPYKVTVYLRWDGEFELHTWVDHVTECPSITEEVFGHMVYLEVPTNVADLKDCKGHQIIYVKCTQEVGVNDKSQEQQESAI